MRVPCTLPVGIEGAHGAMDGTIEELSASGGFVALARPLPEDAEVGLVFVLDGTPLSARGRVRWSQDDGGPKRGVGIVFEDLSKAAQEQVSGVVARGSERLHL